eukprot:358687-Chlamydomonas_euryale.AAC.2
MLACYRSRAGDHSEGMRNAGHKRCRGPAARRTASSGGHDRSRVSSEGSGRGGGGSGGCGGRGARADVATPGRRAGEGRRGVPGANGRGMPSRQLTAGSSPGFPPTREAAASTA